MLPGLVIHIIQCHIQELLRVHDLLLVDCRSSLASLGLLFLQVFLHFNLG